MSNSPLYDALCALQERCGIYRVEFTLRTTSVVVIVDDSECAEITRECLNDAAVDVLTWTIENLSKKLL